ncbi:hypothetical protein E2C01_008612 [Portunus trituberculatus]|uniref:Uncharacterized protein n=1 Tax=Portunus trituberculatus TaxID=210409 RepID=A0A5B7D2F1_PORTR|nr:hypothetical protein [Portunus trituberculatus]
MVTVVILRSFQVSCSGGPAVIFVLQVTTTMHTSPANLKTRPQHDCNLKEFTKQKQRQQQQQ